MKVSEPPWGVWCLAMGWCLAMAWSVAGTALSQDAWIALWAFDPSLVDALWQSPWNWAVWWAIIGRVFSAQFVHIDWTHLLGNVAYFFVFGVQVERRMGFIFLLSSALLIGALAYALPVMLGLQSEVIVAGASGAVSGILGLYLMVCSRDAIPLWLPLGLVPQFFTLPAWVLVGSWLAVQLIFALNATTYATVAVATHLSGFVAGFILGGLYQVFVLEQRSRKRKGSKLCIK